MCFQGISALQPFYLFFSAHAWREDHVEVLGARLYQTIKQNETNTIDFFLLTFADYSLKLITSDIFRQYDI